MTTLGPGAEFDHIRTMIQAAGHSAKHIGDDAAILQLPSGENLVVSTDTSVENVHFRRDWMTFEEIGYRATAAALSDLAAMAATPIGVVIAYAVPSSDSSALDALARGAGAAAAASGTVIVGGDVSSSATVTVTATVLGVTARPLLRSGARPGDVIYLTGVIGGPSHALKAFQEGRIPAPAARDRFVRPVPRMGEAHWLAERGATSCIDVSDGLAGELWHIASASGVKLNIATGNISLFDGSSITEALASGEEYELCVTIPQEVDQAEFQERFGIPISIIGGVFESAEPQVDFDMAVPPGRGPFNHFVNDHS